jgi:glycoprotein endo-alpha-1,2-mannosidase
VTNYDVYGSMGRPIKYAGTGPIDDYYTEQMQWRTKAIMNGCRFIPAASPGYNDRSVRFESNHPPLSRKLTADSEEGSSFKYQLAKALPLVDPMANNMILINSFNEWHEDTQLEPAVGITASLPVHLTGGLQYAGYGDLYLNILREYTETTEANVFKSSGDGF